MVPKSPEIPTTAVEKAQSSVPTHKPQRRIPGLTYKAQNAEGYAEYTLDKDPSVVLILIPEATFNMGSTDGHADERPVHAVTLSDYLIGKTELTNAQWKKYCDAKSKSDPADPKFDALPDYFKNNPNHPVVNVSHKEIAGYLSWSGLDLPTEAQWELAARGEKGRKYPWGDAEPTDRHVRFGKDRSAGPVQVGKLPSGVGPYGTMEQAGNVWERCRDWFFDYEDAVKPKTGERIVSGASSRVGRVGRGGCFFDPAASLQGWYRGGFEPGDASRYLGFRPSRDLD